MFCPQNVQCNSPNRMDIAQTFFGDYTPEPTVTSVFYDDRNKRIISNLFTSLNKF